MDVIPDADLQGALCVPRLPSTETIAQVQPNDAVIGRARASDTTSVEDARF